MKYYPNIDLTVVTKPEFVIFLNIKYTESINYCIKTNSEYVCLYVIVYKAFIQESHFFHNTNGVHEVAISFFSVDARC